MLIRDARLEDVDDMVALGRRMHAESPYWAAWPYSDERTAATLRGLIDNPGGVVLVARIDGAIVGGAGALVTDHWSVDVVFAAELFLFVAPEHRGGLLAARLIRAMDAQAKTAGAQVIQVGAATGVNDEMVAALYELRGFERRGIALVKTYEGF